MSKHKLNNRESVLENDDDLESDFTQFQYRIARGFKNSIMIGSFSCSLPMLLHPSSITTSIPQCLMFFVPIVAGVMARIILSPNFEDRPLTWRTLLIVLFVLNFMLSAYMVYSDTGFDNFNDMEMLRKTVALVNTSWVAQQIIFILGLTVPLHVFYILSFALNAQRVILTIAYPAYFHADELVHFLIAMVMGVMAQIQIHRLLRMTMLQMHVLQAQGMSIGLGSWLQTEGHFSAMFTLPLSEPKSENVFYSIKNPVEGSADEKLDQLEVLTRENAAILDNFFVRFCKEHKFQRKQMAAEVDTPRSIIMQHNAKARESIRQKAIRPEILARHPDFGIEHVRDTFRFKVSRMPQVLQLTRNN
jgi:hypothetical protein